MVAIVKLTEGPILETWLKLDGRTPALDEVDIGRAVRIEFEVMAVEGHGVAECRVTTVLPQEDDSAPPAGGGS